MGAPFRKPMGALSRLAGLAGAAAGEFVVCPGGRTVAARYVLGGKLGERALHLLPDAAERDSEHTLTALEQIDDLVRRGALVDADPIAHQGDLSQIVGSALAQVHDGRADLL